MSLLFTVAATLQLVGAPLPPGAHPHEVAAALPESTPSLRRRLGAGSDATEYPYVDLISEAVQYCYSRLVEDPSCCIDSTYASGTSRKDIARPGSEWQCAEGCVDGRKGQRGGDALWVPDGATCDSPRVIYVHGGSWMYGSPFDLGYDQVGAKLSASTGSIVLVPDYPLIPVGNYTVIMEAMVRAVQWLAVNGPDGPCPGVQAPLFVGGDSAGGGTALSLVLRLQAEPSLLPNDQVLAGAFFWSPWTNLMCNTPEYYHHAFAKIVANEYDKKKGAAYVGDIIFQGHPMQNLDWFTANAVGYVGNNVSLLMDPIASPYYMEGSQFQGIPPLYFAVGSSESIMGDSVMVAQRAAANGVDVQLDIYTGMWHVFPMYTEGCGMGEELEPAVRAVNNTVAFIRSRASMYSAQRVARAVGNAVDTVQMRAWPWTMLNYEIQRVAAAKSEEELMERTRGFSRPSSRGILFSIFTSERVALFLGGILTSVGVQGACARCGRRRVKNFAGHGRPYEPLLA